jgi:hypothetical protein
MILNINYTRFMQFVNKVGGLGVFVVWGGLPSVQQRSASKQRITDPIDKRTRGLGRARQDAQRGAITCVELQIVDNL